MHISQYIKKDCGFTLVETLVAITILLLVIMGPLTIAQKGIQNVYYANEQVTAVFLAQEAIEAVRELRDTKALDVYQKSEAGNPTPGDTADWIPSVCGVGVTCAFDVKSDTLGSCSSNDSCKLSIDAVSGKYVHDASAVDSPFTRTVSIGASVSGGVPVTVDVSWSGKVFGGTVRHVILQTWIYDQYSRYEN